MGIKSGLDIQKIYNGPSEATRVYSGSSLIYDKSVFGVTLYKDVSNNLVANASGGDFDFAIYDWRVGGASIAKFNIDLRSNVGKDYSTYSRSVVKTGSPTFTATGGPAGGGYWNFPSQGNYFTTGGGSGAQSGTFSIWGRRVSAATADQMLSGDWTDASGRASTLYVQSGNLITQRIWNGSAWVHCTNTFVLGTGWRNFMTETGVGGMKTFVDGAQLPVTNAYATAAQLDTVNIGQYHIWGTWDGDACMMVNYNRYLSGAQKTFIANQEFNKIAAIETSTGETWSVEVTPVKNGVDGTPVTASVVV